jgi:ribosomal protein L7/L12
MAKFCEMCGTEIGFFSTKKKKLKSGEIKFFCKPCASNYKEPVSTAVESIKKPEFQSVGDEYKSSSIDLNPQKPQKKSSDNSHNLLNFLHTINQSGNCNVKIVSVGSDRLNTIKIVHQIQNKGIKEVKKLLKPGYIVKSGISFDSAQNILEILSPCGTLAEIIKHPPVSKPKSIEIPPEMKVGITISSVGGNKISVIKLVRELSGLGLKESKALCDKGEKFYVNAGNKSPEMISVDFFKIGCKIEMELPQIEEKPVVQKPEIKNSAVKIKITNIGSNKISVIRVIREFSGLGLKEAKDLCENGESFYVDVSNKSLQGILFDFSKTGCEVGIESSESFDDYLPPKSIEPVQKAAPDIQIRILNLGPKKISVIKVIRELTQLGLKESKELTENNENFHVNSIKYDELSIKEKFSKVGCEIEIIS